MILTMRMMANGGFENDQRVVHATTKIRLRFFDLGLPHDGGPRCRPLETYLEFRVQRDFGFSPSDGWLTQLLSNFALSYGFGRDDCRRTTSAENLS